MSQSISLQRIICVLCLSTAVISISLIMTVSTSQAFVDKSGNLENPSMMEPVDESDPYNNQYKGQKDEYDASKLTNDSEIKVSTPVVIPEKAYVKETVIPATEENMRDKVQINAWVEDDEGNVSKVKCHWERDTYVCEW